LQPEFESNTIGLAFGPPREAYSSDVHRRPASQSYVEYSRTTQRQSQEAQYMSFPALSLVTPQRATSRSANRRRDACRLVLHSDTTPAIHIYSRAMTRKWSMILDDLAATCGSSRAVREKRLELWRNCEYKASARSIQTSAAALFRRGLAA
jgi:hypothetical protein